MANRVHLIALKLISKTYFGSSWHGRAQKEVKLADVSGLPSQINYITQILTEARLYYEEQAQWWRLSTLAGQFSRSSSDAQIGSQWKVRNNGSSMISPDALWRENYWQNVRLSSCLRQPPMRSLGRDALILRATMLKKSFNRVDEKRN